MDKLAWGYVLAIVAVVCATVALCLGKLSEGGYAAATAGATTVLGLTSYLRARPASVEARVIKAVNAGTGDGSIPAKPEGDSK